MNGEVAMKICIPTFSIPVKALMTASISPLFARAKLTTSGFVTAFATALTAAASPGEAAAKPASMTSIPSCSKRSAISTFSS